MVGNLVLSVTSNKQLSTCSVSYCLHRSRKQNFPASTKASQPALVFFTFIVPNPLSGLSIVFRYGTT